MTGSDHLTDARSLPPEIDTTKPNIARFYDYLLGGKDNFEADRNLISLLREVAPEIPALARENRKWLIRVVRHLATRTDVDQYLDCGSGLPTVENIHQVAQRVKPESKVVYIDNDPTVIAHGRALLEDDDQTRFIPADFTRPRDIFDSPDLGSYLDLTRPYTQLMCLALHHVQDTAFTHEFMATYRDAMPSGSYLALTHFHDAKDGSESSRMAQDLKARYRKSMGQIEARDYGEIAAYFGDFDLVEPGLTLLNDWWPDGPRLTGPSEKASRILIGGVARKP